MKHALRPIRTVSTALGVSDGLDAIVVIPARNEQRRISACLEALATAIETARPVRTGVVVVVNNSDDATCDRALAWAVMHHNIPVQVIDCAFLPKHAHAGSARRLGLDMALNRLKPDGVLLTSDADSRVRPDWITRNLEELTRADLVCGAFAPDPEEARALPAVVAMHCHVETAYMAAAVKLAARLDPLPHDPDPPHLTASGASLAFSRALYEAVGGMPAVAMSEDRVFAALADLHDFRVRHCNTAMVDTSCRMTGRTEGGMAGTLRARAVEKDPLVDQWLEPAATFVRRHELRGRLRPAWGNPMALQTRLADALGRGEAKRLMAAPLPDRFGAFLSRVEADSAALERVRMRMSECRTELPRLDGYLQALTGHLQSFGEPSSQTQRASG